MSIQLACCFNGLITVIPPSICSVLVSLPFFYLQTLTGVRRTEGRGGEIKLCPREDANKRGGSQRKGRRRKEKSVEREEEEGEVGEGKKIEEVGNRK